MSAMSRLDTYVQRLKAEGFDQAEYLPASHTWKVQCSQCEALVINGHPTHETGCRNAMRECAGCDTLIPALAFSRFCQECAQ